MMSKINIIPIFVPHLGCPNDCAFCNQKKITGINEFSKKEFLDKLNYFLDLFKDSDKDIELAFYGGSFTAIDRQLQYYLLGVAKKLKDESKIDRIRMSTRPDGIDEEVLSYLDYFDADIIELGVQSLDDEVLKKSKRGHNSQIVYKASELIKDKGFVLGHQQMLGLPGDNFEKSLYTALEICKMKPQMVRIYPTLIIKNTDLEDMYNKGEYKPLELNEAVELASKLIMIYNSEGIDVIRVGLQSTEELQYDKDVVAGPLHDAFRELCESEILYKILDYSNLNIKNNIITIKTSNRNISLLVGQKAINKEKIKKLYKLEKIKFIPNNNDDLIEIIDGGISYKINIQEVNDEIVEGWKNVFKKY